MDKEKSEGITDGELYENGHLFLLKSSTYDELIHELAKFQENLQKVSKTPISTEKLF